MSMFCYQCQETLKGTGCTIHRCLRKKRRAVQFAGFAGLYFERDFSVAAEGLKAGIKFPEVNDYLIDGLFMTITNVNWDDDRFVRYIKDGLELRERYEKRIAGKRDCFNGTCLMRPNGPPLPMRTFLQKRNAPEVGVLATKDEDIRSLREMITYGIKGMAAYAYHARVLGKEKEEIYEFMINTLAKTLDDALTGGSSW